MVPDELLYIEHDRLELEMVKSLRCCSSEAYLLVSSSERSRPKYKLSEDPFGSPQEHISSTPGYD
jgi:hypothetical protein